MVKLRRSQAVQDAPVSTGGTLPLAEALPRAQEAPAPPEAPSGVVRALRGHEAVSGRAQIHTPEFKRWFGASKVVDANGEPLALYHGTNNPFFEFDPGKTREGGVLALTSNQELASSFALYRTTWCGASVMPVWVCADSLLEVDGGCRFIRDVEKEWHHDGMLYGEDVRSYARRNSYAGILFKNVREDIGPEIPAIVDVYMLFDPVKIKSALGNCGAFNSANPDIRA